MFQPKNQGLRVQRISNKSRGQKSGDTVPLKHTHTHVDFCSKTGTDKKEHFHTQGVAQIFRSVFCFRIVLARGF